MSALETKVGDFLSLKRIAIAGVSRTKPSPANIIFKKLKDAGYEVFAVNPNSSSFEGDPCYADLKSIPGGVDGVVIVTRPTLTEDIVRQCAEAGVSRVWMHQSIGTGATSVSSDAVRFCNEHSISVIDGACPMMFCKPVDFGHKVHALDASIHRRAAEVSTRTRETWKKAFPQSMSPVVLASE